MSKKVNRKFVLVGDTARANLASYPGPFTRAVRAGREIRAWLPVVPACVEFYWNPGKIVFFGIF